MENSNSIYGTHLARLQEIVDELNSEIQELRVKIKQQNGMDLIDHCMSRIKSEDSMREKCRRKGLEETTENALFKIKDAIGFRIVCTFVKDVFKVRDYLKEHELYETVEEKDYINYAKPNGYRSYHMILKTKDNYRIEVQIRTISMDTWAALEHHLKYKKNIGGNEGLIVKELKRCADELASTDVSMQTIKDMIFANNEENK